MLEHLEIKVINTNVPIKVVTRAYELLSVEERKRAYAISHHQRRCSFILGRAALREMLAEHLPLIPTELKFAQTQYGKPIIEDDSACFSVSHSGSLTAIAIANRPIGIDIEKVVEIDIKPLQSMVLSTEEYNLVQSSHDPTTTFFNLWTQKEAALKAVGLGLSYDLRKICFNRSDNKMIAIDELDAFNSEQFVFERISLPAGYVGSLVMIDS